MQQLVQQILAVIADYHCDSDTGFVMTEEHVTVWVNQFEDEDREFILTELLHLLNQGIYISKEHAKVILLDNLKKLSKVLGYGDFNQFLSESFFLRLQPKDKSQYDLLIILEDILKSTYDIDINQCGSVVHKNFIYIDDILGSGKTILRDVREWMSQNENLKGFTSGDFKFCVLLFCNHKWSESRIRWSLKYNFNANIFTSSRDFVIISHYVISDNKKDFNTTFNLAIPQKLDIKWDKYLANIEGALLHEDRAYRDANQPKNEVFFSSPDNRNRFEDIILNIGIGIIEKIQDIEKQKYHRPLGRTYSNYKTFGNGTLFFTWRNVSNTCPIVFWWDNSAHNWKGLFPLKNRGI